MGAAFADIAVAANHRDFAGDHHVHGALDAVRERFATAVEIVELGFGDRVVDVDGRDEELACFQHLVQPMHAGGGFFANALPIFDDLGKPTGPFFAALLQQVFDDLFFVAVAGGIHPVAAVFHFVALVQEQGGVAAVVDDEFRAFAAGMRKRGEGEIPVFLRAFHL